MTEAPEYSNDSFRASYDSNKVVWFIQREGCGALQTLFDKIDDAISFQYSDYTSPEDSTLNERTDFSLLQIKESSFRDQRISELQIRDIFHFLVKSYPP